MKTYTQIAALFLAMPLLGGAGICGVVLYDIAIREIVYDPVKRVNFTSDSGYVEVVASKRNGTSVWFYMTGSEPDIDDVGQRVDGDTLEVFALCAGDYCNANFSVDVPFGTEISASTANGALKLTHVDASVVADVVGGDVTGVQLRVPTLDLTVAAGAVTLELLVPPEAVHITVEEGSVALTLPAGAYRCDLCASGTIDTTGITCDDAAPALLAIAVATGDIAVTTPEP